MKKVFLAIKIVIFVSFMISKVKCGSGALDEQPRTEFNTDLSELPLLVLTNVNNIKKIEHKFFDFFKELRYKGHNITFQSLTTKSGPQDIKLDLYGKMKYHNIIIFDLIEPEHKSTFSMSLLKHLLNFVDNGNNILVFTDTSDKSNSIIPTSMMRRFAKECAEIEFHPSNSYLVDIVGNQLNEYNQNCISSPNCLDSKAIFSSDTCNGKEITYCGIGFVIKSYLTPLSFPLLKATDTTMAFLTNSATRSNKLLGNLLYSSGNNEIGLVVSMQARNGARVTFSGDGYLCSNDRYMINGNNKPFCNDIASWTFQKRGLIKLSNIQSHKIEDVSNSRPISRYDDRKDADVEYTVGDFINFSAEFYHNINDKWEPYPYNDIQLELTMLNPYIRTGLQHKNDGDISHTIFHTNIKVPEVFGIYKFVINHKRIGYNYILYESLVTIRSFRHDQNQRLLISAYPFYTSFLLTLTLFIFFVIIFVFIIDNSKKSKLD
ncbi:putative dolichyl-diphosphooligosaccharide--protein glycotransferase [Cryptosporidium serpentis]